MSQKQRFVTIAKATYNLSSSLSDLAILAVLARIVGLIRTLSGPHHGQLPTD